MSSPSKSHVEDSSQLLSRALASSEVSRDGRFHIKQQAIDELVKAIGECYVRYDGATLQTVADDVAKLDRLVDIALSFDPNSIPVYDSTYWHIGQILGEVKAMLTAAAAFVKAGPTSEERA
ncbi:hypothetical protein CLAFUW4_04803 [Fulvia fulva]|uniref:Uncharacterized protein n=1 Tax=Passalora fulva TaxID=5499 RepID=A0A9Q8UUB4_PASFU|nr:uncharacterized protein CLAFUR5_12099 [Fulvia fulva]KAK4627207.1 hypothetical protein CLAFUR4_04789 [Fulvia fulva]KAK4628119.1 hypothetical protein CLAFUR0_04793 [Fulvia fulva]UJO22718.1 hypothetical protein CLAFUR5_12099 [Fulvia fulva]WPV13978.1 hypothetical protein CLAFUW4_04803 [Fulvia fulva]WPV29278.1 hypothetical protein CLAFUW7_04797 [Fulvia fulva]